MGRKENHIRAAMWKMRPKCLPIYFGNYRPSQLKGLSYHRLPLQPLKLSVAKLDGSSFEVQVAKTASVAELRLAVEEVTGEGNVCWSVVWGYFCLCHRGKKLVNDKVSIRAFGIKDGDQLQFVRHLSTDYRLGSERLEGANKIAKREACLLEQTDLPRVQASIDLNVSRTDLPRGRY